jgi:hypothetical protein
MWIGLGDFIDKEILNEDAISLVRSFLYEQLGTSSILHIGLIPDMAFSKLNAMVIDDYEYQWNAYSVTSVARHLIKDLNLVNDEPSPYYVTSILLPSGVALKNEDVVDHVLELCRISGTIPNSPDDVFEYLKSQKVRMTKTTRLMEKIKSFGSW